MIEKPHTYDEVIYGSTTDKKDAGKVFMFVKSYKTGKYTIIKEIPWKRIRYPKDWDEDQLYS